MCRQKIASFVFLAGIVLLAFDSHVSAENPSGFKGVCTVNDSCTSVGQCSDYDLDSLVTPAPSDTTTTHIELQAKLLNYFLGSNKSNINQNSNKLHML